MYAVITDCPKNFTEFLAPGVPTPVYLDDNLDTAKEYARYIRNNGQLVRLVKVNKTVSLMISARCQDIGVAGLRSLLTAFQMPIKVRGQIFPDEQAKKYSEWSIQEAIKVNPALAEIYK